MRQFLLNTIVDHFAGQIEPGEESYRIWRVIRD